MKAGTFRSSVFVLTGMENHVEQADSVQEATDSSEATRAVTSTQVEHQVWMLKRQSSATSRQFVFAYGVIAGVILGTASLCALAGAWLVLPCAIVETLAIGGMFWLYTRRERGYDCIELFDGTLIVTHTDGKRVDRSELNPLWAKVALGTGRNPKIEIRYAGSAVAIGGQIPVEDRQRVAAELNQALLALRARAAR